MCREAVRCVRRREEEKKKSRNFFFFNDTATTEIYTLSLHDALPISYGDADVQSYMNFYHNLQIEKKKQGDGTTIYILKDINTGEVFQFASRSNYFGAGVPIKT